MLPHLFLLLPTLVFSQACSDCGTIGACDKYGEYLNYFENIGYVTSRKTEQQYLVCFTGVSVNVSSFAWTLPIAASTLGLTRTIIILDYVFFSRTWKPAIQMRILVTDIATRVQ